MPARFQSSDESSPHGEKNKDTKGSKSKTKDKKDSKKKPEKEKKSRKKGRNEDEEEDDEPDQEHTHVGKKKDDNEDDDDDDLFGGLDGLGELFDQEDEGEAPPKKRPATASRAKTTQKKPAKKHADEAHNCWNESHVYNSCTLKVNCVGRWSHHGPGGRAIAVSVHDWRLWLLPHLQAFTIRIESDHTYWFILL